MYLILLLLTFLLNLNIFFPLEFVLQIYVIKW